MNIKRHTKKRTTRRISRRRSKRRISRRRSNRRTTNRRSRRRRTTNRRSRRRTTRRSNRKKSLKGGSFKGPETQNQLRREIQKHKKVFDNNVDESNLRAKQTTDSIKNQGSIGTRVVTVNQARNVIQLPEEHHQKKIQPSEQKQHKGEIEKEVKIIEEVPRPSSPQGSLLSPTKNRKFVSLFTIFDGKENLKADANKSLRWPVAKDLVKAMHAAAARRERFHLHHIRGTEKYSHLGSKKESLDVLLTAIEAVSTKKNNLSTQIHPQDLIHLFGELLDQLKFEIQIRGHMERKTNRKHKIETLLREDKPYLVDFKYLLEWFGEKLLACMIHLSLTIESAHTHKFNADAVEKAVLHGIDRIIAMPVALSVGGTIGPIQVEKKVAKFLDKFTDKLIQGQLDRRQLHFISIIEELYEHLIQTLESPEFQSLLPAGSVH